MSLDDMRTSYPIVSTLMFPPALTVVKHVLKYSLGAVLMLVMPIK
jgi:hypothetical protein